MRGFQYVLNNNTDIISGEPHDQRGVGSFNAFLQSTELFDSWRSQNDTESDFTWHRMNPFIARRLDYL